ncbi:putative NAD binding Rossmann fold oxidoreductase [Lepidopterella palustris CBS 459.81]|uniref:Putative NAD binding Rossmann fold oxidoreductase n=1 Tax=Lepidopterella palustris CBS 459.81 TaxID=1314670 RepID=A0A8E2E037_9PEZI|nr:putative NAD binding Rossmann fold oxidoreductase [Lepidopterella palustris CBS 459.81]
MSPTYNVAIIGYGLSAKIFHIPFLSSPTFKLYGIVQRTPNPDSDPSKDFPGTKVWRTSDAMLADAAVDIVVVTTLPDSHFSLTKAALEAGKHVIVEKPFVPTSSDGYELCKIAKERGRCLSVYQNRRWDADFLTIAKLIKDGTLGRVVEFETHFDRHSPANPHTWRQRPLPGVGQVYDLGTHLLDQAVHLFGLPERVTAFVGNQRDGGMVGGESKGGEDAFTVLLHYPDGLLVTAKAACISPESEQLRFWVRGDKGSFRKCHLDVQEDQLKAGLRPGDAEYGVEPESHYGTLTTMTDGGPTSSKLPTIESATYTEYYRLFAQAIEGKGEVPVSPEDASKVIGLIELAKESSKTWQTMKLGK